MTTTPDIKLNVVPESLSNLNVSHLDQYFGYWAHMPERLRSMVSCVNGMDIRAHVNASAPKSMSGDDFIERQVRNATRDGVAIINLSGTLMKFVSSMADGTSTVFVRQLIRQAASDDRAKAILLHIDSPGGTVAGTFELVGDIIAAGEIKPVHAYIDDLGASAAYAIAVATSHISGNASGLMAGIGTYATLYDLSKQAEMLGIGVHVVKAGEHKGDGVPGTEITEEQIADVQRIVDSLNEHFIHAVQRGRNLSIARVRELADGRVHPARDAKNLGLIDAVETFDAAFNRLVSLPTNKSNSKNSISNTRRNTMSAEEKQEGAVETSTASAAPTTPAVTSPAAATITQIKAEIPDASSDFLVKCVEGKMSMDQVRAAHMGEQKERLDAQDKEIADLKAKQKSPGLEAVGTGNVSKSNESGDPVAAWKDAIKEKTDDGMDKAKAVRAVVRENPELHQAYIAAANAA